MLVVAVEGPACAGKTTLIRHLSSHFPKTLTLPDYVEVARTLTDMPHAPSQTVEEELNGLRFLIAIDRLRWQTLPNLDQCDPQLILLDRSVQTLIAHRYAIERMTSLQVFQPTLKVVANSRLTDQPSVILYLDVPQTELSRRHKEGDGREGTLFVTPAYNSYFRSYFLSAPALSGASLFVLDGAHSIESLTSAAADVINRCR